MVKIINPILIVVIFLQIIFSFFYSSDIITQNNQLYQNQQQYQELKIEQQVLEKEFTQLTSLDHLSQLEDSQQLIFLKNKIELQ
jgi:type II secretory pathway component PulJ